jgi:MFS family permease
MVVASRAIQGLGAGGITPTASAVVGDTFPLAQRGRALGLIGATYGMAFVLGPPLAGLLMVALSWRWIFLVNLPIAAVVILLGRRLLPTLRPAGAPPALDLGGIAVSFLLLICFVLGITRIADGLWRLELWPGFLAAAAVLVAVLIAVEKRAVQPMIPLSLFGNHRLATAYVLAVGGGFGMGSIIFLTSIATVGYGVSSQHAGFVLLPLVIASMVGSAGSGRLLNRVGARGLLSAGFALLGLGYGASAVTAYGLPFFLAASVPVGLGLGVVVGGALRSIALDEAPAPLRATAQGLVNIFNAIGTLSSAAAIGAIADIRGGGTAGFTTAYVVVAAVMLAMLAVTLRLRRDTALAASDALAEEHR